MISNLVLARHCTFSPSMLWHRANRCQMLFNALKFGASISSHSHGFALNRFSKLSRTHLKRFPLLLALLLLKHFGRCGDETTEYSTYFIESSLRRPSSIDQILCTSIVEHRFRFYKRHMLRCISEHTIIGTQRIQVHKGSLACCRENIDRIKNRKGKNKEAQISITPSHTRSLYFIERGALLNVNYKHRGNVAANT